MEWVLLTLRALAVLILYAFLLLVVYLIWRDLHLVASDQHTGHGIAVTNAKPVAWLRIVPDMDTPSQAEMVFVVFPPATLGRAEDNQIVLQDEWVSAYHARIDNHAGRWWLTDLGSRNGTRLNDAPITETTPLTKGDIIGLGRLKLRFEAGDGTSHPDPHIIQT
ncbi:MAG: FHA domain-containing protein [Anaerolineae bacterium]|nr:FHA domain-containing protein [Anaerolineae bacterium]MDW8070336.1 FHA domain-containing protein [Anaerolineae bacterium]